MLQPLLLRSVEQNPARVAAVSRGPLDEFQSAVLVDYKMPGDSRSG
jgi:hypothetical protein